jgi:hypothetical protein
MTDRNSVLPPESGWVLTAARDSNDQGQIVGTGTVYRQARAFLPTPVQSMTVAAAYP